MTKLLAEIKSAMDVSPFYALKTKKSVAALVEAGHAELNEGITEGKGATAKFAVRLTEAGIAALAAAPAPATPVATPATFAIIDGAVLPPRTRTVQSKYPLDQLGLGQSIFVPAGADVKKVQNSVASAITGFMKRNGVKRFSARTLKEGQEAGAFKAPAEGVLVVRVADKTAA